MSMLNFGQDEDTLVAVYLWAYESTRKDWISEHPRERHYHVKNAIYPQNRFWMKDLVEDSAKTAKFRYLIEAEEFWIVVYKLPPKKRYGKKELMAAFRVQMRDMDNIEIKKSPYFYGPDAKLWNYEWKFGGDPYKMPHLPVLAPGSPDVVNSSLFAGPGVIHKQYPKSYYPTRVAFTHHYPHRSFRLYGNPQTRRMGLPSALPKFSTAGRFGKVLPRKVRREQSVY
jgi:hypothetical protein